MKAKNSLGESYCPWLTHYILNIRERLNIKSKKKANSDQPVQSSNNDSDSLKGRFILIFYFFLIILFSLMQIVSSYARSSQTISGKVTDEKGEGLAGAIIKIKNTALATSSGKDGTFQIKTSTATPTLIISFIGYRSQEVILKPGQNSVSISLTPDNTQLSEVQIVSTGYQTLPKERSTGSFVQINNELLNRRVSTNILDRLDGITSGLLFNGQAWTEVTTSPLSSGRTLGINIRGESTLSSGINTDPLIVLDNFPFEGNISSINPNDIENITVLKDAAAASIWGARSGNGVIVITTKKGGRNKPLSLEVNSNATFSGKPDLYYDKYFLNAADYIGVETYLFDKGYFDSYLSDNLSWSPVSPVVDLLQRHKEKSLSDGELNAQLDEFRQADVRRDFDRYVYRRGFNQQYSLALRGGSDNASYSVSAGLDQNRDRMVRNGYRRVTLNTLNSFSPLKNLDITAGLLYSQGTTDLNNDLYWGSMSVGTPYNGLYPYASFADGEGNPQAVVKDFRTSYVSSAVQNKLLDWSYRPLDEIALGDRNTKVNDLIARTSVKYRFMSFLAAELQYQNEWQTVNTWNYHSPATYYARDLVNTFSKVNAQTGVVEYQLPKGGVLDLGNYTVTSNNLRGQLYFDHEFMAKHEVHAIAGAEIKELKNQGYTRTSYGYDDEFGSSSGTINFADFLPVNPSGTARISPPDGKVNGTLYRYLSYYANASYSYLQRYTMSLSARKDGSNIFGVNANDRMTPLWSAGLSWQLSREPFYAVPWLSWLRLRASYGFNGNVYNGSAYVTGGYNSGSSYSLSGQQVIAGLNAPNPDLSWERVKNINAGFDFSAFKNRLTGTVEWYRKDGLDLIDQVPLASSSGFSSFMGNSAGTRSKGFDISLTSKNISGRFRWETSLLLSTLKDKVTKYNAEFTTTSIQRIGGIAVQGRPLYSVFSYKWAGLDGQTGDPQGYLNGAVSKDYTAIMGNFKPDSLVFSGSARPTLYGSVRNDFTLAGFSLSVNIVYKLGYYFRRATTSLNYADLISASYGLHEDYLKRWQQPGDEARTEVPSLVYPSNPNRSNFYKYSQATIEKGDHIRLQDIRLAYTLKQMKEKSTRLNNLQIFCYASNVGILWRENDRGIDPDVSVLSHNVPAPLSLSFGFNANF